MIPADQVRTVAVVGTGAIGTSWAALLLDQGLTVLATDPAPGAEDRLVQAVAALLAELGTDGAWTERLTFTDDPAAAAASADLVLENGPEQREVFALLDAATGPDVLLASSSSGLGPSRFQDACARHPERVLVAHPFNPPHLVPLVEVVGGERTSDDAVTAALSFFERLGKRPIHLRRELPGHVANRLQAALWREAYHLVDQGVVSVADLDTAIAAGPGLRWALLGPLLTQHVSGGAGGLAHVLEHLGPPMVEWWDDLGHPELTPELAAALVAGVGDELGDRSADETRVTRDRALRELLDLKRREGL